MARSAPRASELQEQCDRAPRHSVQRQVMPQPLLHRPPSPPRSRGSRNRRTRPACPAKRRPDQCRAPDSPASRREQGHSSSKGEEIVMGRQVAMTQHVAQGALVLLYSHRNGVLAWGTAPNGAFPRLRVRRPLGGSNALLTTRRRLAGNSGQRLPWPACRWLIGSRWPGCLARPGLKLHGRSLPG